MVPSICEVTYTCQQIVRTSDDKQDNGSEYITCADVTFDGTYDSSTDGNSVVTDGKLTFTATSDDYTNDVRPPGTYTVTILGTATESSETQSATFEMTLTDVCNPPTTLTAPGYEDQSYVLTLTGQSYTPTDFVADPAWCPFTTTFEITDLDPNTLPSAVTKGTSLTWDFSYDQDLAPVSPTAQTQTVTVTATAVTAKTDFNAGALNVEKVTSDDFELSFVNPCLSEQYATLTATTQADNTLTDSYSGTSLTFTHTPFTVVPDICPLTITCKSITGPSTDVLLCTDYELDAEGVLNFSFDTAVYNAGELTPGEYTFTYKVSTGSSDAALNQDFSFTLTLVDPCATATVSQPTFTAQEYTITDETKVMTFSSDFTSAFSVDPSFCSTDLTMASEPATIDAKLTFDSDAQTLTVSQFSDSLDLSGATSTDYSLTFTYNVNSPYSDTPV